LCELTFAVVFFEVDKPTSFDRAKDRFDGAATAINPMMISTPGISLMFMLASKYRQPEYQSCSLAVCQFVQPM
jgi:hypothetical protein